MLTKNIIYYKSYWIWGCKLMSFFVDFKPIQALLGVIPKKSEGSF